MKIEYVRRAIETAITKAVRQFPVVILTGPRQVGKSTTLKTLFPKHSYFTLDDPIKRKLAIEDPGFFLDQIETPALIDEVQYAPSLLPFIKMKVDQYPARKGVYIHISKEIFVRYNQFMILLFFKLF